MTDPSSPKELWSVSAGGFYGDVRASSHLSDDKMVLVSREDVIFLDMTEGKIVESIRMDDTPESVLWAAEFVAVGSSKLTFIDPSSMEVVNKSATFADGAIKTLIVNETDNSVMALETQGKVWSYSLASGHVKVLPFTGPVSSLVKLSNGNIAYGTGAGRLR